MLRNKNRRGRKVELRGDKVSFVTVEPGVQLEVLDWGGTGQTLVLLTGIGDNAHVFDEFAYQFNDRFHVIGITRRGFGRSSQPAHGYDVDTRARDDITVLDKLNIREAVFVGHSLSGTELNKIGAVYPDRVQKLVYLAWTEFRTSIACRCSLFLGTPLMSYLYSQTDKTNLGWFDKDNSKATLLGFEIIAGELRGPEDLKIKFKYPITAISGKNGTGKSTILACIACAFRTAFGWHRPALWLGANQSRK